VKPIRCPDEIMVPFNLAVRPGTSAGFDLGAGLWSARQAGPHAIRISAARRVFDDDQNESAGVVTEWG
jgi:hypothetical protein